MGNSIIQPITVSRGQAFDSSISNVWRRTREIQIKNELAKRLPSREVSKKKKAKNVKQIAKHDDPKLKERRKLLQELGRKDLAERNAREVGKTQNNETVTVSTEEYAKVHMNREHYAVMDKNWR